TQNDEAQAAESRLQALSGGARRLAGLLAALDVVLALHDVHQAVDVDDLSGHVGSHEVAQDVALLGVEVDELGAGDAVAIGDHLQARVDAQVDGVEVQVDGRVVERADGHDAAAGQAHAAQGDVVDLTVVGIPGGVTQGDAGGNAGADKLTFVQGFVDHFAG